MAAEQSLVSLEAGGVRLNGDLVIPGHASSLVIFAHGSGSSRFSPRNRRVAGALQKSGFATLLLDLLTQEEERVDEVTREHRFDISLLAERVAAAVRFARGSPGTARLAPGLFGASTGAAAALVAAARDQGIGAVVSRGGRPDLAADALAHVKAPTLLIVGGADHPDVLRWNRESLAQLRGARELAVIPAAGHLFEEPGALERVIELSRDWFTSYLVKAARE